MSEPIPESIPTSADPRSKRPTKKRALSPISKQASSVEALFANPHREIRIPSGLKDKSLPPPPEIVTNVQGSSAGAGSGEFHVYKASRRREYERVRMMDEASEKEKKDAAWEEEQRAKKEREDKKLSKNQARRAKARQNKEKVKGGVGDEDGPVAQTTGGGLKGAKPKVVQNDAAGEEDGVSQHAVVEEQGFVIHDED